MPLISHEVPKQLFELEIPNHEPYKHYWGQYPYLLAHKLLHEYSYDKEYADFYKKCVLRHDISYLDNSCYELGFPVETHHLIALSKEYKVSHIVIPDAFRDCKGTIELANKNLPLLIGNTDAKLFCVLQGKSLQEALDCYDYFNAIPEIDIIGINFMRFPDSNNATRYDFFKLLLATRKITKKIHFLGCENPAEFKMYKKGEMDKVYSIDTSSPIVSGWNKFRFTEKGLEQPKPKELLANNLDIVLDEEQLDCIAHNVKMFRSFIYDKPFN